MADRGGGHATTGPARAVVFRLRWGPQVGWGHVVRCAALAVELRRRGAECRLWSEGNAADLPKDVRAAFADPLPAEGERRSGDLDPNSVPRADWWVIDDYAIDDETLRELRNAAVKRGARLLVLDDEARRRLDAADLILNSRLGLRESPYARGVPALLGEAHALLRPGLRSRAGARLLLPGERGVLVMLGGTDPRGLTAEVLQGLADFDPAVVPVVIGRQGGLHAARVGTVPGRFPRAIWRERAGAAELAALSRDCGYAISAAGGSLYELALLRRPFLAVVTASNQEEFAAEVARRWRLPVLANGSGLRSLLPRALHQLEQRIQSGAGDLALRLGAIDGRGAERVAARMLAEPRA